MTTHDLLERGKTALKAGRKAEARALFERILENDERSEQAWLWLSGAVDTDADRRICLENVLEINPHNGRARKALDLLRQREGQGSASPFVSVRSLKSELSPALSAADLASMTTETATETVKAPEKKLPEEKALEEVEEEEGDQPPEPPDGRGLKWIIGCGALFILLVIVALGAWWAMSGGLASPPAQLALTSTRSQTRPQTRRAPPTWTPTPSATPADTATPRLSPTARPSPTPVLTWTPTFTPTQTITPTVTMTGTSTLTPTPTLPPVSTLTLPPTWTPQPSSTPAPGMTLPPTWTPQATQTPAPGMTLPPTWTPLPTSTMFPAPTPSSTITLTATATITATAEAE